jgi:hypothetical protein
MELIENYRYRKTMFFKYSNQAPHLKVSVANQEPDPLKQLQI